MTTRLDKMMFVLVKSSYIKIFIENQLALKSNEIRVSVTVHSIKCLPLKEEG